MLELDQLETEVLELGTAQRFQLELELEGKRDRRGTAQRPGLEPEVECKRDQAQQDVVVFDHLFFQILLVPL